jgi:hypothetical protein
MVDKDTMREAAIHGAKLKGCTCDPDVDFVEVEPNIFHTTVAHDEDCHLIQAKRRGSN